MLVFWKPKSQMEDNRVELEGHHHYTALSFIYSEASSAWDTEHQEKQDPHQQRNGFYMQAVGPRVTVDFNRFFLFFQLFSRFILNFMILKRTSLFPFRNLHLTHFISYYCPLTVILSFYPKWSTGYSGSNFNYFKLSICKVMSTAYKLCILKFILKH